MHFRTFWDRGSAALSEIAATTFTPGLQSGIAQLGSGVGPRYFQAKWAHNNYNNSVRNRSELPDGGLVEQSLGFVVDTEYRIGCDANAKIRE